ncbi:MULTISPECIES: 50S ribosomal protein L30 [Alcaligenaceae]|jgi:large subunit ribosomal protein L30|uniref:Large ribosomal subunit protein uL30 n=1 Tax=Neopusillimonas maritima TaxID=2026239 RepID=A0A3A1YX81_9BURK|nr:MULTISPECIES: 50S ribosomal protein L30 [Alcaligenaceae]MBF23882.1 50S ribosomal protein L30 [Pusillimonas sp.]QIM48230.1 50S ribosomal protein L30 [Pusillimonas sp. DMV24BSW_D]RII83566.1 50S ribosomal protein L30 [Neopusillimonas maritima]RIY41440.1 50S ribosomal protein L30 [Neopusillimonas maritima]|tara:strand:- start:851 stop:1039 length:189 start_codon:yes stop_codon:yes gene_type:complete
MTTQKQIKVTLVRSVIGTKQSHRATVRGLGLRRVNSSRVLVDTPEVRGMIRKVDYLVAVSEV